MKVATADVIGYIKKNIGLLPEKTEVEYGVDQKVDGEIYPAILTLRGNLSGIKPLDSVVALLATALKVKPALLTSENSAFYTSSLKTEDNRLLVLHTGCYTYDNGFSKIVMYSPEARVAFENIISGKIVSETDKKKGQKADLEGQITL